MASSSVGPQSSSGSYPYHQALTSQDEIEIVDDPGPSPDQGQKGITQLPISSNDPPEEPQKPGSRSWKSTARTVLFAICISILAVAIIFIIFNPPTTVFGLISLIGLYYGATGGSLLCFADFGNSRSSPLQEPEKDEEGNRTRTDQQTSSQLNGLRSDSQDSESSMPVLDPRILSGPSLNRPSSSASDSSLEAEESERGRAALFLEWARNKRRDAAAWLHNKVDRPNQPDSDEDGEEMVDFHGDRVFLDYNESDKGKEEESSSGELSSYFYKLSDVSQGFPEEPAQPPVKEKTERVGMARLFPWFFSKTESSESETEMTYMPKKRDSGDESDMSDVELED